MDKTFYRRLRQPVPASQTPTSQTTRPPRYAMQRPTNTLPKTTRNR